ncbi:MULTISPECIES: hypothetical protein [Nitrosomonas]|uniref:Uncharacterized protein n=3 Tax=Nitrosomonas communis TaxID=44574 RepID=A0A0F7KEY8_9PROT|nr:MULTISPECIES: hypothetical protein [Nitrosomonas]AKH37374.1 hypothetical protein AAW31_05425 [Nitrosomonas communis]UVS62602.1 hypothetical protein NX761_05630 [Nitrosomonas sp. PLL12]
MGRLGRVMCAAIRMKRLRNWHAQPIETPIAVVVCSIDKPSSKGSTTACACFDSSIGRALISNAFAWSKISLPLADRAITILPFISCFYYFTYEVQMELALIQQEQETRDPGQVWLIDSFPVILARQGRRFKAYVAKKSSIPVIAAHLTSLLI